MSVTKIWNLKFVVDKNTKISYPKPRLWLDENLCFLNPKIEIRILTDFAKMEETYPCTLV